MPSDTFIGYLEGAFATKGETWACGRVTIPADDEVRGDSVQTGTVLDTDGKVMPAGRMDVRDIHILLHAAGRAVFLWEVAIAGIDVGCITSAPLEPGVSWMHVVRQSETPGDNRACPRFEDVAARGAATMMATDHGEVAIDWLRVHDRVMPRDHGPRPVRRVGSVAIDPAAASPAPGRS